MDCYLKLRSGKIYTGKTFGNWYGKNKENNRDKKTFVSGEVVFQTGMSGYEKSMTDPSYQGQLLCMTYPMIGNYGVDRNSLESSRIHVAALIVQSYEESTNFNDWLVEEGVPGIYGIDTRQLTRDITETEETIVGKLVYGKVPVNKGDKEVFNIPSTLQLQEDSERDIPDFVSSKTDKRVLIVDCGIKYSQLEQFKRLGASYRVISISNSDFIEEEFCSYEATHLFISNGPGNPLSLRYESRSLMIFMRENPNIPIFGVCMGHQLLALAAGARTYKMKYGNRGLNIPCKFAGAGKAFITSQNHGYAVDLSTMPAESGFTELFVNLNDGTNEGIIHRKNPWFSVQFHPEAGPGPHETFNLFEIFLNGQIDILRKELLVKDLAVKQKQFQKVLILGSGGLKIGQGGEFDYTGSQAIKAFKEYGLDTVLINPNIANVQTNPGFSDKVYFVPVTPAQVKKVIEIERPDCIALSFGGQTALNCGIKLEKSGILEKYGVSILGTPIQSIIYTEDRKLFGEAVAECSRKHNDPEIRICPSFTTDSFDDIEERVSDEIGYPCLIRAGWCLGGLGSGFAKNAQELQPYIEKAKARGNALTIDKSIIGWRELEYEIVRDSFGNCISVCNMENMDPVGIHTGESIVVAPSQTLTDYQYNRLREVSLDLINHIGIVGECNIQFALHPETDEFYIIEVNPRLSRSSALASKATGYPLAAIAVKIALGENLTDLENNITKTSAFFEPALDYCAVKIPHWDISKSDGVDPHLGTAMKSIGEALGVARNFPEAFQKALRMSFGKGFTQFHGKTLDADELRNPTYKRIYAIAKSLYEGQTVDDIVKETQINPWFIEQLSKIIKIHKALNARGVKGIQEDVLEHQLIKAKQLGLSDLEIALASGTTESAVMDCRLKNAIVPFTKQIDTVAAEFPCYTNYLYTTYNASYDDILSIENDGQNRPKIIVLGSGVYRIGCSVEFDCSAVYCIEVIKKYGYESIVINCNPDTVSTDYDVSDKLYFEELTLEKVMDIYRRERGCIGVIVSMGGQIGNNMAMHLHRYGVKILGTSAEMIDMAENRFKFSRMLESLNIDQPKWKKLTDIGEAVAFCKEVEYPCLVRPSYVLRGAAMNVAYDDGELVEYLGTAASLSKDHPVVITKFIQDAKEIEVDGVAINGQIKLVAVSEHVENAGVHSGDATLLLPPRDITKITLAKIRASSEAIVSSLKISGPFNIQFIAKDNQVKVIECNVRVSRTFPFVIKTCGINFIEYAIKWILKDKESFGKEDPEIAEYQEHMWNWDSPRKGVKIAQFSFNRLPGSDAILGVEMLSTGEVASYGSTVEEAFLKAYISSGFDIGKFADKKASILLTIGGYGFKKEFLKSVQMLAEKGFTFIGTSGTADYFSSKGVDIEPLTTSSIKAMLIGGRVAGVFNFSPKYKVRENDNNTPGYIIRRTAIESGTPLITDIKKAKLLISALDKIGYSERDIPVSTICDSLSSYKTIQIPPLTDVHVHVREPGNSYKEDWSSLGKASLAGGVSLICVMPNTNPPIVDEESFNAVEAIASSKCACDHAIFVGANNHNSGTLYKLAKRASSLKMYLNNTYGPLLLDDMSAWYTHIREWTLECNRLGIKRPICCHAELDKIAAILHTAMLVEQEIGIKPQMHICHVARKAEIELIKRSKSAGMNLTCEVAPHHLFIMEDSAEPSGENEKAVKPPLATNADVEALWENMDVIDCFATDHAPHTPDDKHEHGCPGFPGLETFLPLMLKAINEGRLTVDQLIEKAVKAPQRIFSLPAKKNSYVEINLDERWTVPTAMKYSKCGWTPFAGMEIAGKIKRVIIDGQIVVVDDQFVNTRKGKNIRLTPTEEVISGEEDQKKIKLNLSNKISLTEKVSPFLPKHILSADQFDRTLLKKIFMKASEIRGNPSSYSEALKGRNLAIIFEEPSTRTRCSFAAAANELGAKILEVSAADSSSKKGESFADFFRIMSSYVNSSDTLLVRTKTDIGDVSVNREHFLINAGDGSGEHPTQALTDIYTIQEECGSLYGLTITIMGDLKNGRTVHSLVNLLCKYNVIIRLVGNDSLRLPEKYRNKLSENGIEFSEHSSFCEVIEKTDVLYMTRLQRERLADSHTSHEKGYQRITPEILSNSKKSLVIMHPLPRVDEIDVRVDKDPRAAYFRQAENKKHIAKALLAMLYE